LDKERLRGEASALSTVVSLMMGNSGDAKSEAELEALEATQAIVDKWERTSRLGFWKAVYDVAPELAQLPQIQTFVDQVYSNEDMDDTLDALHLLHDLKLWPGVVEQEHWDAMADALRHQLCVAAQKKSITTKEDLCVLFADDEGRPKKLAVSDFLEICRTKLDLDLTTNPHILSEDDDDDDDEDESPKNGELVAFVQCFVSSDEEATKDAAADDDETAVDEDKTGEEQTTEKKADRGLLDAGELLWKLLLWPGAEEEHRALAAGRTLRQDLVTTAEQRGLETVGDLWATLMGLLTGNPSDTSTKTVDVDVLVEKLVTHFGSVDTDDLRLYVKHFLARDSDRLVDLPRLLHHLELFSNDDDDEDPILDVDDDPADFADFGRAYVGDDEKNHAGDAAPEDDDDVATVTA